MSFVLNGEPEFVKLTVEQSVRRNAYLAALDAAREAGAEYLRSLNATDDEIESAGEALNECEAIHHAGDEAEMILFERNCDAEESAAPRS